MSNNRLYITKTSIDLYKEWYKRYDERSYKLLKLTTERVCKLSENESALKQYYKQVAIGFFDEYYQELMPLSTRLFRRYALKDRNKFRAKSYWNIGYDTGETQHKLRSDLFKGNTSVNVTTDVAEHDILEAKFHIPDNKELTKKLTEKVPPGMFHSGTGPTGNISTNSVILNLAMWVRRKLGVSNPSEMMRTTYAIVTSWNKYGKKPLYKGKTFKLNLLKNDRRRWKQLQPALHSALSIGLQQDMHRFGVMADRISNPFRSKIDNTITL
jgi:hypothetical protein